MIVLSEKFWAPFILCDAALNATSRRDFEQGFSL